MCSSDFSLSAGVLRIWTALGMSGGVLDNKVGMSYFCLVFPSYHVALDYGNELAYRTDELAAHF